MSQLRRPYVTCSSSWTGDFKSFEASAPESNLFSSSAINLIGKRINGVQKAVVIEKQQPMGSERDPVYVSQPQEYCVFMSRKYIFFTIKSFWKTLKLSSERIKEIFFYAIFIFYTLLSRVLDLMLDFLKTVVTFLI